MNIRGYDPSVDYGKYPTLAPLPARSRSDLIRCEHCGGTDFLLLRPDGRAVCKQCGGAPEMPRSIDSVSKQRAGGLQILSTRNHTIILNKSGGIWAFPYESIVVPICVSSWPGDVVSLAASNELVVGLRRDGSLLFEGSDHAGQQHAVRHWSGITAVSAGAQHIVGLFADGTVRAAGENAAEQCNVQNWTDITAIAAGAFHTVGLRKDGTVCAIGNNNRNQCNVQDWTDIISIAAGHFHTVGLCKDGTVKVAGATDDKQYKVENWCSITAIAATSNGAVGLRTNGTVCYAGEYLCGSYEIPGWTNISQISTTHNCIVAIQHDGTIVCTSQTMLKQINEALA